MTAAATAFASSVASKPFAKRGEFRHPGVYCGELRVQQPLEFRQKLTAKPGLGGRHQLADLLGRVPAIGDCFELDGVALTVERIEGHRIAPVRAVLGAAPAESRVPKRIRSRDAWVATRSRIRHGARGPQSARMHGLTPVLAHAPAGVRASRSRCCPAVPSEALRSDLAARSTK